MERKLFQAAILLAWLALPLTALNYRRVWDRLPMRIAIHFDANWQANGWTTREGSRMLALGMSALLLVIFTVASYAVLHVSPSALSKWTMVGVLYVVLGLVYFVNRWIVDRNFTGQQSAPVAEVSLPRDLGAH